MSFSPTATHDVGEVHDTVRSMGSGWLAGFALGSSFQPVPLRVSMSVTSVPSLFVSPPTAVHVLAATQDTPFSSLKVAPDRLGACDSTHLVPL